MGRVRIISLITLLLISCSLYSFLVLILWLSGHRNAHNYPSQPIYRNSYFAANYWEFRPENTVFFWYLLNPLVIVELSGNLHFAWCAILLFGACTYCTKTNGKVLWF
jgi:hypothetical protein